MLKYTQNVVRVKAQDMDSVLNKYAEEVHTEFVAQD